jgi:hypothetical protein
VRSVRRGPPVRTELTVQLDRKVQRAQQAPRV